MSEEDLKYRIDFNMRPKGMWSFGLGISHWNEETYLFVNLFTFELTIGKFYK